MKCNGNRTKVPFDILNNSVESKSHKLPEFIDNCNWCTQSHWIYLLQSNDWASVSMCVSGKKSKVNFSFAAFIKREAIQTLAIALD